MTDADFEDFCKEFKDVPTVALLKSYALARWNGFFDIEDTSINVTDDELRRWVLWCVYYGKPKEEYPLATNK